VALVGIDKNKVFALGWGLGSALVGLAGAVMAMFFYIYPEVGASFAPDRLCNGGARRLWFGVRRLCRRHHRRPGRGVHRTDPAAVAQIGRHLYAVYLLVVFIRPRGMFGSI